MYGGSDDYDMQEASEYGGFDDSYDFDEPEGASTAVRLRKVRSPQIEIPGTCPNAARIAHQRASCALLSFRTRTCSRCLHAHAPRPPSPPTNNLSLIPQAKFAILRHDELLERQRQTVQETADLLCVSANEAARVLRFYKW